MHFIINTELYTCGFWRSLPLGDERGDGEVVVVWADRGGVVVVVWAGRGGVVFVPVDSRALLVQLNEEVVEVGIIIRRV